jgi:SanA protein
MKHGVLGAALLIAFSNTVVLNASRGRIFSQIETVPHNHVGLLLGTSPYMRDGSENPFFRNRVEAAARLYEAGRIDVVLASGDNLYRTYNEPARMRAALVERGIPEDRILVDTAGYRTLDSVVRAGTVFGWKRFTIISQEFHNHRALFVASESNLDAIAFSAEDVGGYAGLRQTLREHLARTLAVLDVHLLGTAPREASRVDMSM